MRNQSAAIQTSETDVPFIAPGRTASGDADAPPLPARFMLPDSREFSCAVSNADCDGAHFHCQEAVAAGLPIVAYVEELGRVEAITAEAAEGGFRVIFTMTGARREKWQQKLNWLRRKRQGLVSEERRNTRFQPGFGTARITFADGGEESCEVLDISLSGAALRCPARPLLGSCVMLGKTRGRVTRHWNDGFAMEFLTQIEDVELYGALR